MPGVKAYENKADFVIKDKWSARQDFEYTRSKITIFFILSFFSLIISPVLFAIIISYIAYMTYNYMKEYFLNPIKKNLYSLELAPQLAFSTYLNVGYEVPRDVLDKHIEMLRRLDSKDKEAIKYLATNESLAKAEPHRLVGISKSQLTTHFWIIGTTGAGKTSFIMQMVELLAKQGGGMIFIDGKADTGMVFKMITILTQAQREQDFYVINFLPKEKFREHTNTFNPLSDMNAPEIVEFLMSAKGEPTGDQAYWAGRGKALLQAIVYPLYFRKKYYSERFTIVTLNTYLSDLEKFLFLAVLTVLMLDTYENHLYTYPETSSIVESVKSRKVLDTNYPRIDAVVYYYSLAPHEKKNTKIDVDRLSLLFDCYNITSSYIMQVAQTLWQISAQRAQIVKNLASEMGVDLLTAKIEDIMSVYDRAAKENPDIFNTDPNEFQQAIQQHAYAQQQWTDIFNVLMQYSNVFGSNEPEIDILDVLKNNKFLYVLLPALAASNQTTKMLGNLMLAAIRKAISTALGEAIEGIDDKQRDILKKRITPIPLGLLVLDEYGAYPIKGIDTILAQVRSINISTILATQDYTSARAEGQDENAVKRAWANTQKLVLRIKDWETIEMLDKVMPEEYKVKYQYLIQPEESYVKRKSDSASLEKEKAFDAKLTSAFKNGLGIFIAEDKAVLTQIFWADAKEAGKILLNHSTYR